MVRHKITMATILTACLPFCCLAVDLLALPRAEFAKYYGGNCKTSFVSRVERVERVDFDLGMSQMVRSAA